MEAKMRSELLQITMERDEKAAALVDETRKNQDLHEENKNIKMKYKKEQTEKIAIERDYRTLKSTMARFRTGGVGSSSGNSCNDETEYYKQKYEHEKLKCQSQKSLLEDKDREISILKRDRDRHLSQNVLASIRASGGASISTMTTTAAAVGADTSRGGTSKKSRYSY
jgi:hypothetical protein